MNYKELKNSLQIICKTAITQKNKIHFQKTKERLDGELECCISNNDIEEYELESAYTFAISEIALETGMKPNSSDIEKMSGNFSLAIFLS